MISVLEEMHLVLDSEERCPFHVHLKLFWPILCPCPSWKNLD